MKIIKSWLKSRKERKEREMDRINEGLMRAGYLCPDLSLHNWKLLEWQGDYRDMKCIKCGKVTGAMVRV